MDTLAEKVDLVKRASEATIEITRQLGADLALAQTEIGLCRAEVERQTHSIEQVGAAYQHEREERIKAQTALKQASSDFEAMVRLAQELEKVFSEGYGFREKAIMAQLTRPMSKALHRLHVGWASRQQRLPPELATAAPIPAESSHE